MQRRPQHREQRRREERRPPPEQPPRHRPHQHRRAQHEHQRQHPRPGQPPGRIRQRPQRRVNHRSAREVIREGRHGRAMQPVRPLQVPGPQVRGLILISRVGADQPQRQGGLHGQHQGQRPARPGPQPHAGDARAPGPGHRVRRQHRCLDRGLRHRRSQPGPGGRRRGRGPACSSGSLRRRRRDDLPACRRAVFHSAARLRSGTRQGSSAAQGRRAAPPTGGVIFCADTPRTGIPHMKPTGRVPEGTGVYLNLLLFPGLCRP